MTEARRYFTGKPCKNGHLAERFVSNKACCTCSAIKLKKYREANREVRNERARARAAEFKKANPNYKRPSDPVAVRKYYERNKEACAARTKSYREQNLAKYAAYKRNRDARQRQAEGAHSLEDINDISKMQRGKCGYCRIDLKSGPRHVDHIKPLAKGGSNMRSNLQILCKTCNLRKADIDPIDFAQRTGRLL